MSRMIVVVGDATSGGGKVLTGSPDTDIEGKAVARIGDQATCAACGGVFSISTGDATFQVDGASVARHGDFLTCGHQLVAGRQFRVFLDALTSDTSSAGATDAAFAPVDIRGTAGADRHDEAFVLISELTGKPLRDRRYRITLGSGAVEEGTTDESGRTHLVQTVAREALAIELREEALEA